MSTKVASSSSSEQFGEQPLNVLRGILLRVAVFGVPGQFAGISDCRRSAAGG
jgi:hypothetical protein